MLSPLKKIAAGICERGVKTETVGKEYLLKSKDILILWEFYWLNVQQQKVSWEMGENQKKPQNKKKPCALSFNVFFFEAELYLYFD